MRLPQVASGNPALDYWMRLVDEQLSELYSQQGKRISRSSSESNIVFSKEINVAVTGAVTGTRYNIDGSEVSISTTGRNLLVGLSSFPNKSGNIGLNWMGNTSDNMLLGLTIYILRDANVISSVYYAHNATVTGQVVARGGIYFAPSIIYFDCPSHGKHTYSLEADMYVLGGGGPPLINFDVSCSRLSVFEF